MFFCQPPPPPFFDERCGGYTPRYAVDGRRLSGAVVQLTGSTGLTGTRLGAAGVVCQLTPPDEGLGVRSWAQPGGTNSGHTIGGDRWGAEPVEVAVPGTCREKHLVVFHSGEGGGDNETPTAFLQCTVCKGLVHCGRHQDRANVLAQPCVRGGGGGWHKAWVVGSVSLWRRLLAFRP